MTIIIVYVNCEWNFRISRSFDRVALIFKQAIMIDKDDYNCHSAVEEQRQRKIAGVLLAWVMDTNDVIVLLGATMTRRLSVCGVGLGLMGYIMIAWW